MKTLFNHIETLGTACGIVGAFLVAGKFGAIGYPFFFASSLALLGSAIYKKQGKFIALQAAFFAANVIGLFNYV